MIYNKEIQNHTWDVNDWKIIRRDFLRGYEKKFQSFKLKRKKVVSD